MACPNCKPICKCQDPNNPEWRHELDCEWYQAKLPSISVQMYQIDNLEEWLRMGLKIFHMPAGAGIPAPWDLEKIHPMEVGEGNRHPFYKCMVAGRVFTLHGYSWQWQFTLKPLPIKDPPDDTAP